MVVLHLLCLKCVHRQTLKANEPKMVSVSVCVHVSVCICVCVCVHVCVVCELLN